MSRSLPVLATLLLLGCAESPPVDAAKAADPATELAQWRGKIDEVDREIIALLNRRAGYVLELAPLKRRMGMEVQDAGREQAVLANLRAANAGPLPDASVDRIYQAIMAAMRDLQAEPEPRTLR